jgi:hypothetical protein
MLLFPLSEGHIFYHTKLVLEVHKFSKRQRLNQNICYMLISTNVLQLDGMSLDHVSDEMIFHLNMLCHGRLGSL